MHKLYGFIPNKVSGAAVISVFEFLRKIQKLFGRRFEEHFSYNKTAFQNHRNSIIKSKGYVEDQNSYTDLAYGKVTMQYAGCEIFAVYNAVYSIMGKHIYDLPEMISWFEKDGMVVNARFGTAPKAALDFLKMHGFDTTFTVKEEDLDLLAKECQSLILTIYNDKNDIRKQVHTVNISKENGEFTVHNAYCNGKILGPFAAINELMQSFNGGKAKVILLIGINKA